MEPTDFPKLKVKREEPVKGAAAFVTVIRTPDGQAIIGASKKSVIYKTCLKLGVSCRSEYIQKTAFIELEEGDKDDSKT